MREGAAADMRDVMVLLYDESNRGLDARSKRVGLSRGQLMVMDRIWRWPGLTQTELARSMSTTKQYVSQMVKRLEELGYVTSKVPFSDGRKQRLYLTDHGKETQQGWWDASRERVNEWAERLTGEEQARLADALGTILELVPKIKEEGSAIF